MNPAHALWTWSYRQAYLLLALTTLMWSGNAVAGRLAVGEISPMALTCLRWVIVVSILATFMRRQVVAEWPLLKPHLWRIVGMGALGFTGFNALFYEAAHHTSAVNLTIVQGAIPVFVILGALLVFKTQVRLLQIFGMTATVVGVVAVATKGDWEALRTLTFNIGDIYILIACLLYACYTLALRNRPKVPGLVFFTMLALVAFVSSLPLLAYEIAAGTVKWPTPTGWLVLLYVGIFPSLLSQVFFMRGVELIGPGRAGLFVNLVPVFGAVLAVLTLGEPFATYHAVALALVLGGIWLAERK